MRKIFITLLVLICTTQLLNAQYFNYLAKNASIDAAGTYTDLGNLGTAITTNAKGQPMTYDNDNSSVQNIGFTFNFAGTNFTNFTLNSNGFITLGTDTTPIAASFDVLFSTAAKNVIYPFNIDLQPAPGTAYRGYTSGTAGSKVCTIQFKSVADSGCTNCNPPSLIQYDAIEFQIKLYEGTNNVEFVYGLFTPNLNASGFIPANCGLKTVDATRSINVTKASTTLHTALVFLDGAYTGNRFNNRNSVLPSAGFTIRFVPLPILANNVHLQPFYTLGKLPQNIDHTITTYVENRGSSNLTNFPVTLNITGANTVTDVQTIASLPSGQKQLVTFSSYHCSNLGTNQIIVKLPTDDDDSDNADTLNQLVTSTTIGTCYDSIVGGSLGQSTNSIDLAILVRNPSTGNKITSLTLYFASAGQNFNAKIFRVSAADTPSTQISTLGNRIAVAGKNVITLASPLAVTGDFFIVLTQSSTTASFACGFQREDPIRAKTFYFRTPSGLSGKWNDFAPNNSFRIMADVTMQSGFLPVKLTSFTGKREGKNNILMWQTASETNSKGFEIERSSDGINFRKIGFENSRGNANTLTIYTFVDDENIGNNNYYRLRMIDKDGTESFSEIINIKNPTTKKVEIVSIYPNPARENIVVEINNNTNEKMMIQITDLVGKTVSQQELKITNNNKVLVSTSALQSGTYLIKVVDQNNTELAVSKFIKL